MITRDLVIVGGGIAGVICLKYARDAGFDVELLEQADGVGGLWRKLPAWQDIQIRRQDWTLGDIPIAGESQPDIVANIEAWVERYGLARYIRLSAPVRSAAWRSDGWHVATDADVTRARCLVAASGGHSRPHVPHVLRSDSRVDEFHSSELRDPGLLSGRRIVVVGGGASAYDLLDLCLERGARSVVWIYRSLKWMRPTLSPKVLGTNMRLLARHQMIRRSTSALNKHLDRDLRARYERFGLQDIVPDESFDIGRHQLIPGRHRMIRQFDRIERHQAEIVHVAGRRIGLSTGSEVEADTILWATGYDMDLSYLAVDALRSETSIERVAARCGSVCRSLDASNLYIMGPGVLETSGSTPWAYAHLAKSIMSDIAGSRALASDAVAKRLNYFDLARHLARADRRNYPPLLWVLRYLWLAVLHPYERPMPVP
ncbi:MAG TPA: NAD(P)/FAD-dependent oxidoreductase [Thermomicrobiales bacterium]|nr:NAD(P)/FAD-dependent oxidoreductase [Thermomicrobiales bacterium]